MPTEKKVQKVSEVQDELARCTIAITTSYVGLNANDMTSFRQKLREQKIQYRVVKNTLARIAATNAGKEGFSSLLQGQVGVAFGFGEETVPARVLTDFIRTQKSAVKIIGALLGNRVLSAEEVNALAMLPSRDILLARLLGQMGAPLSSFVGVLSASLRNLVGVLEARRKQLESAAPPVPPAATAPAAEAAPV
ncbi:MAG: 50S ribosomal protein L10 [Chloroflexi bacterium]|nr:50S ribosomal protein L10 [Chloroflexota bacterium]